MRLSAVPYAIDELDEVVPDDPAWLPLRQALQQLQKYRLVVEHTANMVVITNAQRQIEYVNPAYTAVTGWTLDEVRGRKPGSFLQGPETDRRVLQGLSAALQRGEPVQGVELLNYTRSGQPYWVSLSIQPVRNEDNEVTHFVAIQADISERRRIADVLRSSERRLAEALRVARMGSFECDLSHDRMTWSPDAARVMASDVDQALPGKLAEHLQSVHEQDRQALAACYRDAVVQGRAYEIEYRLAATPEQAPRWIREWGEYFPPEDALPERLTGLVQDITAERHNQERVAYLARHDTLTGLINRASLESVLSERVSRLRDTDGQLALLCLGLDRFKNINDSLGHQVGDHVLIEVANRLRGSVRGSDLVCRVGGDEFMILLDGVGDREVVSRVVNQMLDKLSQPFVYEGHALHTSASIGVCLYPQDGDTVEELARNADVAMHQAKASGRNTQAYFSPEANARSQARFEIESRLRLALPRQEFRLHYQPQYASRTGRLVGFEALLRWQPPPGTLVGPDEFIPVAEESGLISSIGLWVLREACQQWASWRAQSGRSLRMSVNLSARQLRDADLLSHIEQVIREHAMPPDALELELTETVTMHDPAASAELMRQLRDMGVSLAVDDFGTGYSSLSYLKTLPVQRLKLDRSFVKDLERNPDDKAICAATIALGHSLGLEVVAEGVETVAHRQYLLDQGCDLMQGYLLGRPMPADQATALVLAAAHC